MANVKFDVEGYVTKKALPFLMNELSVVRTLDRSDSNYVTALNVGTRGAIYQYKKPTRLGYSTSLGFNVNTLGFNEEILTVTTNVEREVDYAYTDIESALYTKESLLATNARSALIQMGSAMEASAVQAISYAGYRTLGNYATAANPSQNTTVADVVDNIARFKTFGVTRSNIWYLNDNLTSSQIIQSSFNQFVPARNDSSAIKGQIGALGAMPDVKFIVSDATLVHTAGTMADDSINFTTGYTIDSLVVTNSTPTPGLEYGTTEVTISGATPGTTLVVGDMVKFGENVVSTNPLRFLSYTGYFISGHAVEGRVITGGTVAGDGTLTFTIVPALIYDTDTTNPFRNLNRAIVPGTDTLEVCQTHRMGVLYCGEYGKFANPMLEKRDPYLTSYGRFDTEGVSIRMYMGAVFDQPINAVIHDALYGFGTAAEGFARVILPV